jgi:hypothetical protein
MYQEQKYKSTKVKNPLDILDIQNKIFFVGADMLPTKQNDRQSVQYSK